MHIFRKPLFLFLLMPALLMADPWNLEGKAGVFIPQSKRVQHIFHSVMPFIELEGSYRWSPLWDTWGEVGCIFDQGHSIGCGNKTTIQVYPFSLGVRRFFPVTDYTEFFLGAGCV